MNTERSGSTGRILGMTLAQATCLGGVLVGCALWAAWHYSAPEGPSPPPPALRQAADPSPTPEPPPRIGPCLSVAPPRSSPSPSATPSATPSPSPSPTPAPSPSPTRVRPCLKMVPPVGPCLRVAPPVGPCLKMVPPVGPCLSPVPPPLGPETPATPVHPCLSVSPVHPCLSMPAPGLGPCLDVSPPEGVPTPCLEMRDSSVWPAPEGQSADRRRSLLARFWHRLRPDLRARLQGDDEPPA